MGGEVIDAEPGLACPMLRESGKDETKVVAVAGNSNKEGISRQRQKTAFSFDEMAFMASSLRRFVLPSPFVRSDNSPV
jgi:hypothetical protein